MKFTLYFLVATNVVGKRTVASFFGLLKNIFTEITKHDHQKENKKVLSASETNPTDVFLEFHLHINHETGVVWIQRSVSRKHDFAKGQIVHFLCSSIQHHRHSHYDGR